MRRSSISLARCRAASAWRGAALLVAAVEVHQPVRPGGILLQHVLDQTGGFHELAPVEPRAQAQARDGVGHRDLRHGLATMLRAHGVVGREAARLQVRVDRVPDRMKAMSVFRSAVQQLGDERRVRAVGQRSRWGGPAAH
jgi:hypothetical protein